MSELNSTPPVFTTKHWKLLNFVKIRVGKFEGVVRRNPFDVLES